MATFLVAHGGWTAGWGWKKMHPLLSAAGHRLLTPTYTGLGERAHLANPDIDLNTHIEDMLGVLHFEDLRDVILVGHSYGGMVATGVADRARDRIAHLVYLDAFVPQNGQCLFDLVTPEMRDGMRARAKADGEGWRVPPLPMPDDTSAEDVAWAQPRRVPQPIKTFDTPVRLTQGELTLPRTYIFCNRSSPVHGFRKFYDQVRATPGWTAYEMEASHNPHITTPQALLALFEKIAADGR